jgi:hypothetical protein
MEIPAKATDAEAPDDQELTAEALAVVTGGSTSEGAALPQNFTFL